MKRRTPLKRTGWQRQPAAPMKRTKLKPVSRKKAPWLRRYSAALAEAKQDQLARLGTTWCQRCQRNGPVDGHHPAGRIGANILRFSLICRPCHDWIHENARAAREEGWLV